MERVSDCAKPCDWQNSHRPDRLGSFSEVNLCCIQGRLIARETANVSKDPSQNLLLFYFGSLYPARFNLRSIDASQRHVNVRGLLQGHYVSHQCHVIDPD